MNVNQLMQSSGIGSEVEITRTDGGIIRGALKSLSDERMILKQPDGYSQSVDCSVIADVRFEKDSYDSHTLRDFSTRLKKLGNRIALPHNGRSYLDFQNAIVPFLEEAAGAIESSSEAGPLLEVLRDPRQIKNRELEEEEIPRLEALAEHLLKERTELLRMIRSMLWYGAARVERCMEALTRDLEPAKGSVSPSLAYQLALATHLINRSEGMELFWLKQFFSADPAAVLAENELCCSGAWLSYIDLSSDVMYFEGIAEILAAVERLDSCCGRVCMYASLNRIFNRTGRQLLALECASAICPDCSTAFLARSLSDLTRYLRSDEDGYCFFSAKAAEEILSIAAQTGEKISCYRAGDRRAGYLFDYTPSGHFSRILGFDLMTYFVTGTVIEESGRRKMIVRSFDLSQYVHQRRLMAPLSFFAQPSFRSGDSFQVTKLL